MKKFLALALMTTTLLTGNMTVSAQYSSGNVSGSISGNPWSGRYIISTAQVYGSITCAAAHDVAAIGDVYFREDGVIRYLRTIGIADPGTSTLCSWIAGTNRTVLPTSSVTLQING